MIFGELNSFVTIIGRIVTEWKRRKAKAVISTPQRFIDLFEAHGVHRNQIPRFFGRDITLSDLADDAALLKKLTEPVLDSACALFAIRREWLDGLQVDPYERHQFYKSPEEFAGFIDGLKIANSELQLDGYLIVPDDPSAVDQAALVLQEVIGVVADTVIYRYHVCDDWVFGYWKSRAYLTACIAIAWNRQVFIKGRFAGPRELSGLIQQLVLPGPNLRQVVSRGSRWYAEDLALLPDQFLQGLDPEQNRFGVISALRLWLELDDAGWMDTGLGKEVRPAFEAELAKYGSIELADV